MLTEERLRGCFSARGRHQACRRALRLESLEARRPLSADAVLEDGVLQVLGTDDADRIEALTVAGHLVVRVNKTTIVYPSEDVNEIAVAAGKGNDVIHIRASVVQATTLDGGSGNDWIHGSRNDDVVLGGPGNDWIYGRDGNDRIDGGLGNDRLHGGGGDDDIQGGVGHDALHGNAGNDTLTGDRVIETAPVGSRGLAPFESSPPGNDWLVGGAGDDTLRGAAGRDILFGGWGDDQLDGGLGNDALHGGVGDDSLFGDAGNDRLWGNLGIDRLDGGAGLDIIWAIDGMADFVARDDADILYLDRYDIVVESTEV